MRNSSGESNSVHSPGLSSPTPHKSERVRYHILVPLILAMGVLLGAFIFALRKDQQMRAARSIATAAQEVQRLLRVAQEQKAAVMATTLQAVLKDERMALAFRERDREALLRRAKPLYESLSGQHKITHFYFHGTNRVNFLRVHRPDQNGDTINRYTAREAERTGGLASGIERGPIGTFVLRVVSPWRQDGQLLGYLELGLEFEDLLQDLHGLLDVDFVAAVYKEFLNREQWDKSLLTYGREGAWDQFPATVVMDKTLGTIPGPVVEYLANARSQTRGTNHVSSAAGRSWQLVFLPLSDVAGKTLGELIVLRDITASVEEARRSIRFIALVCLTVSVVLAGLFYILLTRIEKSLTERTAKLRAEIIERQRAERDLQQAHEQLERRVEERTSELKKANADLSAEIVSRERAQQELEVTHRRLVDASRLAGMAEVATGVLHNVGNVLNSVNVSATLVTEGLRKSKAPNLAKAATLLGEHAADLAGFFSHDPKGKQLPGYLTQLAEHLAGEHHTMIREVESLQENIGHIKEIVAMQQSYAKVSGVTETIKVADLVEDALRLNAGALNRHGVQVLRRYDSEPTITVDKHKVLQVLVNLIRNAKYACDDSGRMDKQLTLRLTGDDNRVKVAVIDNGVGIPAENLTRIFNHGFTTRKDGHGFGLHSGALAAKEMGGSLSVHSEGPGQGAVFTLELPLQPLRAAAATTTDALAA